MKAIEIYQNKIKPGMNEEKVKELLAEYEKNKLKENEVKKSGKKKTLKQETEIVNEEISVSDNQ